MANGNGTGKSTALVRSSADKFALHKATIEKNRSFLVEVMPPHVRQNPDRILRCIITSITKDPNLLDCSPESMFLAAGQACVLGLEPNTIQQLSYIIPFGKVATFIPGWRGLVRLAKNSGEVTDMVARIRREKDVYKLVYEPEEKMIHEPFDGPDGGNTVLYYSRAVLTDEERRDYEVMYPSEVEAIRLGAVGKDSPAWKNHYPRMALKTVTRRHCGRLTLSPEKSELLMKATALDEKQETGKLGRGDIEEIMGPQFAPIFDEATGEVIEEAKDRGEALAEKV